MNDEQATAGASEGPMIPTIVITDDVETARGTQPVAEDRLHRKYKEGQDMGEDDNRTIASGSTWTFDQNSAYGTPVDTAEPFEQYTERDIYQDLEERYAAAPVSPADVFRPEELLKSDRSRSKSVDFTSSDDSRASIYDVSDSGVPQIFVTGPEEVEKSLQIEAEPKLRKAGPLAEKVQFLNETKKPHLRERRRSMSMIPEPLNKSKNVSTRIAPLQSTVKPIPQSWLATDTDPKGGWRMRTRCSKSASFEASVDVVVVYLYNSAVCDKSRDRDADLDLFRYFIDSSTTKSDNIPVKLLQRARTDMENKSRPGLPSIFAPAIPRKTVQQPKYLPETRSRPVNWLQDHNMLQKQIPGARVLTVGFDIFPVLSSVPDFEAAAGQLIDYLQGQRKQQQVPITFIGHTLGGMIIIQSLVLAASRGPSAASILAYTTGVFLFSCSVTSPDSRARRLADLYGAKSSDKIFSDHSRSDIMEALSKSAKKGFYSTHPQERNSLEGPPKVKQLRAKSNQIAIGFPITQFFAQDDEQSSNSLPLSTFLGAPIRTVIIGKDFKHSLRFSGSEDADFQRVMLLVQSSLQTCRLLHATAAGNVDELNTLIQDGANPNLRDRWGQTALQIAAYMEFEHVVHALMGAEGIEVNVRDNRSNTPLHHAVRNRNEAIVRALLHHGADISLQNSRKRSPRDLAEKHRSRMHIAKILRSRLVDGPDQSLRAKRLGNGKIPTSKDGQIACRNFQITITEVYASDSSDKHWSMNISVGALLYGTANLKDILQHFRPAEVKSKKPICTWLHIPENNMIWVEDLFAKLGFHSAVWQETQGSVTQSLRNRAITPHVGKSEFASIFTPYLSYETNFRQEKRIEYIQDVHEEYQRQASASANMPQDVAKSSLKQHSRDVPGHGLLQLPDAADLETYPYRDEESDSDFSDHDDIRSPDDIEEEERSLIKAYLHDPPALHVRRTLDQYYYHMLENTKDRDIDQVVSRWCRTVKAETRHNILMVDQLWLWNVNPSTRVAENADSKTSTPKIENHDPVADREYLDRYVISCFPNRTGTGHLFHRSLDDLRRLVLNLDHRKRVRIRTPEDLVSRILETCCGVFDRMQDAEMLRFFQMFEDSIGSIDDKESRLFRDFQRGSTRLLELSPINKFYNEKKNTLLIDLLDIREEIKLLVEIKDIRDEINIILMVLGIQRTLLAQMSSRVDGQPILQSAAAENMVMIDIDDFSRMNSQARTIQDKLNTLMDLKQKAANAWEAREARETTVAASKQGNTVLVFTVVTIIFLPLSFMSSFFAIGIAVFPKDTASGQTNWPLGIVTGLLFGISLSVSIPLIIFALNMEWCSATYKELRYNHLARVSVWLVKLFPFLASQDTPAPHRKRWTEALQKDYDEYVKNDDWENGLYKTVSTPRVRQTQSFPSTASSHTLIAEDSDAVPDLSTQRKRRRFGRRKKAQESQTLVVEMDHLNSSALSS